MTDLKVRDRFEQGALCNVGGFRRIKVSFPQISKKKKSFSWGWVFKSGDRSPFFQPKRALTWLFFAGKGHGVWWQKSYLLDSYSAGVESGWGSQMVGVFDSPDGCSVWCSLTLGRLIDMLPPSLPPSISSPLLPSPPPLTHSLSGRWIPAPPSSSSGLELQISGWDGTFHSAQRKPQYLGWN